MKRSTGLGGGALKIIHASAVAMARVPAPRPAATRCHSPTPVATSVPANSPCRKPGSASALAKSCAPVNRSAGSFSRAFLIAASTFAGTASLISVAETGAPAMIFPSTACAVLPM